MLVVGAGLSAADAVTMCRSSGISVIHVYRNRSAGLDKMLPETVYPEYHEVSSSSSSFSLYIPFEVYDHLNLFFKKILNFHSGPQNDER